MTLTRMNDPERQAKAAHDKAMRPLQLAGAELRLELSRLRYLAAIRALEAKMQHVSTLGSRFSSHIGTTSGWPCGEEEQKSHFRALSKPMGSGTAGT